MTLSFSTKVARTMEGTSTYSLRLVRGAPTWEGSRYLITTRSFGSDVPNNAVVDRRTGMVWRRCVGNTAWVGDRCEGSIESLSHVAVLSTRAQTPEHWRIPNIKELQALLSDYGGHPSISHFPQLQPGVIGVLWSSTPDVSFRFHAMRTAFILGGENVTSSVRRSPTPTIFVYTN